MTVGVEMPTLFTGEDIPEARVEGLPDRDVFGARGVDRATRGVGSCALVSNSGALKGANLGAEVDAHDLVFRFNNAPTKGYEADVGSKTSVRYTNAAFQGFRERDDEAVMAKWCNEFKRCGRGNVSVRTRGTTSFPLSRDDTVSYE